MLVQLDGRLRELEVAADALQATYNTEKAQVERLEVQQLYQPPQACIVSLPP